ncbi:MAG: hypothetical protein UW57_C0014G0001, partial [Candidatus Giovannonibacteria bacterium GW2011_GWA1_44_29]
GFLAGANNALVVNANATANTLNIVGGNVGIGTTGPLATLHISSANQPTGGTHSTYGNLFVSSNDAFAIDKGGAISLGGFASTEIRTFARIQGKKENATDGNRRGYLAFETDDDDTLIERMRITSTGNVGIGTTTVSAKLHSLATTEQLRLGYDASNYN